MISSNIKRIQPILDSKAMRIVSVETKMTQFSSQDFIKLHTLTLW